eukprot:4267416-Pleurochrysis_carterae.AAC.1
MQKATTSCSNRQGGATAARLLECGDGGVDDGVCWRWRRRRWSGATTASAMECGDDGAGDGDEGRGRRRQW